MADLTAYGFELNPYDPYVMTKQVEGSQMTVVFHVDDLKVSHKSDFEITRLANYLRDLCGKVKVSRGEKHNFLGMDLDFASVPGVMQVSTIPYLNGMFCEFPEELKGTAATPAAEHLFKVRPESNECTSQRRRRRSSTGQRRSCSSWGSVPVGISRQTSRF